MAAPVAITDGGAGATILVNCTVAKALTATVETNTLNLNLAPGNPVAWEDAKTAAASVVSNYNVTLTATPGGPLFTTAADGIVALVGIGSTGPALNFAAAEGVAATKDILGSDSLVSAPYLTTINVKATGSADTPADALGKSGQVVVTIAATP